MRGAEKLWRLRAKVLGELCPSPGGRGMAHCPFDPRQSRVGFCGGGRRPGALPAPAGAPL